MAMQQDAKLLIEDANIDRYIDAGSSQIEELSIGNFKIEIASTIAIVVGVLLGVVPKIAQYASDVYKNHLSSQISDLTNKTFLDSANLNNALSNLRDSSNSIFGSSIDPTPVLDSLTNILSDTSKLQQTIPEGIKQLTSLGDYINNKLDFVRDSISSNQDNFSDSWVSHINKFTDTATEKTIDALKTIHQDLTKINSLSDKINGLADNNHNLSSVSKNIDNTSVDVVWGIIFIALTVIALSIIMKVVDSMGSKNKSVSIKKAVLFMKSTKRIISKSLTKKLR